ncbi:hypothetical protein [Streptomyces sp. NPDC098781]|uniref:hypothetical protein n=1 Tax=Streptomyces sp. NPDC098781 TaxID=3366097 RepID=UPI0037FA0D46
MLSTLCLAFALLLPLGYTTVRFSAVTSSDIEFVETERSGVEFLHPMSKLIAALAEAQSAAVAEKRVEVQAVEDAVAAVDRADRAVGDFLKVHDGWSSLQTKIARLGSGTLSGKRAYRVYSETIDVALALMLRAGDTSNLILDPELDSYYLMDASMIRLPGLIVDTGRMTDLEVLRAGAGDEDLELARVLIARDRISSAASAIQAGFSKTFRTSASRSIGNDLLGRIDSFRSAVQPMAPSVPLVSQPLPPSVEALQSSRTALASTALSLNTAALAELDQLLETRRQSIERDRMSVVFVLLGSFVAAGLVVRLRSSSPSLRPTLAAAAEEGSADQLPNRFTEHSRVSGSSNATATAKPQHKRKKAPSAHR